MTSIHPESPLGWAGWHEAAAILADAGASLDLGWLWNKMSIASFCVGIDIFACMRFLWFLLSPHFWHKRNNEIAPLCLCREQIRTNACWAGSSGVVMWLRAYGCAPVLRRTHCYYISIIVVSQRNIRQLAKQHHQSHFSHHLEPSNDRIMHCLQARRQEPCGLRTELTDRRNSLLKMMRLRSSWQRRWTISKRSWTWMYHKHFI